MQDAVAEPKNKSVIDNLADHRWVITSGLVVFTTILLTLGAGIGVSADVATKIREYVTAILH